MELVERRCRSLANELIDELRVVVINGPRQSGKSTLLAELIRSRGGEVRSLDDEATRAAARADPAGFLADLRRPTGIDEIQLGGDPLVRTIKTMVDADPRPGRFVLAGSSRFLTVPGLSESLAGRAAFVELWPLTEGETAGIHETFVETLLFDASRLRSWVCPALSRAELAQKVCRGGFPEATRLSGRGRRAWFDGYARTLTLRDAKAVAHRRQVHELPRLLGHLAALSSQELVVASLSRAVRLDEDTIRAYLGVLETIYLLHPLPGWAAAPTGRAVRRPKVHLVDTGLTAYLTGAGPEQLLAEPAARFGPLLESFVVQQLRAQSGWADRSIELAHFRDRAGAEVDVVLTTPTGEVAGIEVKATVTVKGEDFSGLRALRDRLDDRFVHGVVLHPGHAPLAFGDRLTALPVGALWGTM